VSATLVDMARPRPAFLSIPHIGKSALLALRGHGHEKCALADLKLTSPG
jgi:hypothetical protein